MPTKKKKITPQKLKTLQKQLKNLNIKWVTILVDQIQNDKSKADDFNSIDDRKVYNVFNGIVKDGGWNLFLYKQGKKLKKKLENEVSKVVS